MVKLAILHSRLVSTFVQFSTCATRSSGYHYDFQITICFLLLIFQTTIRHRRGIGPDENCIDLVRIFSRCGVLLGEKSAGMLEPDRHKRREEKSSSSRTGLHRVFFSVPRYFVTVVVRLLACVFAALLRSDLLALASHLVL